MTIAKRVKDLLGTDCAAFTLYGGYAQKYGGGVIRFPVGVTEQEKRNKDGRVIYSTTVYADGSKLVYRWSDSQGYSLDVIKARIKK